MKKMPSLFLRPEDDPRGLVKNIVNPECQWVLDGEGIATAKLDGSACAVIGGMLYKRLDNSSRKGDARVERMTPLKHWVHCGDTTERGQHIYWVPVESTDYYHQIAWAWSQGRLDDGTYELVGPNVQANLHEFSHNVLVRHGSLSLSDSLVNWCVRCQNPRTFEDIKRYLETSRWEGIVWHHPDGRMVKITRAKFGFPWG